MTTFQLTMKTLINRILVMLAALASIVLPSVHAASSPPDRMSYQGFLVDKDGNPLAPGPNPLNYVVAFRIYAEAEGGNALWAEEQVVTVDKGNFSVVLGEGTAVGGEPHDALSAVFASTTASDRYLGMTVTITGTPLTITPRLRLLPSPYAFLASQAGKLVNPSTGASFVSQVAGETIVAGATRFGSDVFFGSAGMLRTDQGGSLELGNSTVAGSVPFIDFHYGKGSAQDFNMRLINNQDGVLSLFGGRLGFGQSLGMKLALFDALNDTYGFGIDSGTLRFQVGNPGARFGFFNGGSGDEVFTIRGSGNVGFGTATPKYRLHNTGDSYLWGHVWLYAYEGDGSSGTAFVQARDTSGTSSLDIQFRTQKNGGILDVMRLTRDGYVGIGTTTPSAPLMIRGGNGQQIRIQNNINGIYWDIYSEHPGHATWGNLLFVSAGGAFAFINRPTGQYFAGSDQRLKKDIEPLGDVLDRVLKLRPVTYRMKAAENAPLSLGFIAQEVEPLFPQVVSEASGMKGVSYGEMSTIAISGVQSLHKIIEAKESRIQKLEVELADMKKQLAASKDVASKWESRMAALEKKFASLDKDNKSEVVASK